METKNNGGSAEASEGAARRSVSFKECQKNIAAQQGSMALDGCNEFRPSSDDLCEGCGSHKNLHRQQQDEQQQQQEASAPLELCIQRIDKELQRLLSAFQQQQQQEQQQEERQQEDKQIAHNKLAPQDHPRQLWEHIFRLFQMMMEVLKLLAQQQKAAPLEHNRLQLAAASASPSSPLAATPISAAAPAAPPEDACGNSPAQALAAVAAAAVAAAAQAAVTPTAAPAATTVAPASTPDDVNGSGTGGASSGGRKRRRTKFSTEQKEKLHAFATKANWVLANVPKEELERFGAEIGVKAESVRYWFHNAKQKMKQTDVPG